jgi:EmrB/QacA subfamily drug resistance transporter
MPHINAVKYPSGGAVPPEGTKSSRQDGIDPLVIRVAAVVFLGPFMTQLDSTVVNVAIPAIRQQFQSAITAAQWIIGGYLLALALMLPLNGWLVNRVGAKRLYLWCFSAFTLASLLCGTARTMNGLIFDRAIQGIAGGLLAPMAQMMMARVSGRHLARVMGYTTVPILIAPILGPVVAGAILKYAGWRWLFYLNLPIGILAVVLAAVLLPDDEDTASKRPFDFPGFLVISPALVCLLYGMENVLRPNGALVLLAGLILLGVFIRHALREGDAALIDLHLFGNHIFSTAAITQFLSNGVAYSGQFLVPLFLITGCGLSPAKAGWLLAPMGLGMMCSLPFMGYLTDRFGCRAVSSAGALMAFLGTLPFLWMAQNHFLPLLAAAGMFIRGAGQSGIGIPSVSAAYASVPKKKLGFATTAINIVQRLGGPLATSVTAIIIALSTVHFSAVGPRSFTAAFVLLLGLYALVLWSASRLPARIHQTVETDIDSELSQIE